MFDFTKCNSRHLEELKKQLEKSKEDPKLLEAINQELIIRELPYCRPLIDILDLDHI